QRAPSGAGHPVSKPLMEKKRRARINTCLDQLRTLLESLHSSDVRASGLPVACLFVYRASLAKDHVPPPHCDPGQRRALQRHITTNSPL
uniref:BHLH domain-containing protein n=1 Tax=Pygocentrus nattereri TaxID=42514 RepID=A0AAR2KW22_PYGNA